MKKICILFILMAPFFRVSVAQDCSGSSTGFIPLEDLGKNSFQGFMGGKYPEGSNAIPQKHFEEGMHLTSQIKPLNADGAVDLQQGRIGFMVLGYSTAAMTARYLRYLIEMKYINPNMQFIIGAQGGKDINSMVDENNNYYSVIDSTCKAGHLSNLQIQVIWISSGDILSFDQPFPQQCYSQIGKYRLMLVNLRKKFPNLKIVFISDRPYAGYIGNTGPQDLKEPSAYYNSWTVKWLIEKQIMEEPGFGEDEIPFIDWGPALWTDGTKGNLSGYTWTCDDAGKGGIHASANGRAKEATKLYLFFSRHPYSRNWFFETPN